LSRFSLATTCELSPGASYELCSVSFTPKSAARAKVVTYTAHTHTGRGGLRPKIFIPLGARVCVYSYRAPARSPRTGRIGKRKAHCQKKPAAGAVCLCANSLFAREPVGIKYWLLSRVESFLLIQLPPTSAGLHTLFAHNDEANWC
jgi:hypothetical protein